MRGLAIAGVGVAFLLYLAAYLGFIALIVYVVVRVLQGTGVL